MWLTYASTDVVAQAPGNDSCSQAEFISLGTGGFTIGTFRTDSTAIDSATIQTGEYFHSSLVSAGNDKKSIWYKFYLPARRGVNIELKQNANAIGTKDVGFTTFKGDQCLPTATMATAAKITTLNQFGSSFNPCMDPGWYLIQVSAKTRAMGKVYLEITTSYPYQYSAVVNAVYDAADSAYDFGNQTIGYGGNTSKYVDFEMGCYTVEDSSEFFADLGSNYLAYNQSAWFVFSAQNDADNSQLKWRPVSNCNRFDTIAYRLYKGDCRGGTLQLLDSGYSDWQSGNTCYSNCSDIVQDYKCLFDSGFTYSLQLILHEDYIKTIRLTLADQTTQYDSGYYKPVLGASADLGIVRGTNYFSAGFSCSSLISNNACGNANTIPITIGNFDYNLAEWVGFTLDQQSALNLTFSYLPGDNNYKRYSDLAFRLFKDTITSSCGGIDTNNLVMTGTGNTTYALSCLEPGNYALQLLGCDTLRDYSNWKCDGTLHLGGNYRFTFNQSQLPVANRFALVNTTDADSIYSLNALPNYTRIQAGKDTISCNDGVMPEDICDTIKRKVMYRSFEIGDADGDGQADSGMVDISGLQTVYRGYPYYDYHGQHRLYRGNVFDLRASQSVSAYPDTLTGLVPYTDCFNLGSSGQDVCVTPGTYTLVSFFDSIGITQTETPYVTFYSAKPKFSTYASAENFDTLSGYGTWNGTRDTFSCSQNPDTIDGVSCGVRNTYHVFYLDSTAVVTVGVDYSAYRYGGRSISLFKGDVRNGKTGLSLVNDDKDWSCVSYQTTSDCFPLTAGWYTVMVSENTDVSYDSLKRHQSSANRMYYYSHYVSITTRASTVNPRKFYRPSLSGYIDSLVNNNQPITWDTNYSSIAGMHLHLKKYVFPAEYLDCDLDTPLNHFPNSALCDTNTTDIVYYNFNLATPSFVRIWGNVSGGTWDVKLYDFDVRSDSSKLSTTSPIQDCNYEANHVEYCNLQPGTYSVVYFCTRTSGQSASVRPVMYVDSVMESRFDHASYAYDFGAIPGTGSAYDGKIGDVHPDDTSLPASHNYLTCRTGAEFSDPTSSSCYTHINPRVYAGDTNVAMFPYDSAYLSYSNGTYYPWNSDIRRNLWYSFTINGRGQVNVALKSLMSNLQQGIQRTFRFSVFESDEDGSLSIAQLRSSGKIDSTLSDGLTFLGYDYYNCAYNSSNTLTFAISACDEIKPRRYYVLVEQSGYYYTDVPMNNMNVWMEVTYDSTYLPDTDFDHYSSANPINGLNDLNLLVNGSFEQTNAWTTAKGNWQIRNSAVTGVSGYHCNAYSYYYYRNDTVDLYQDVDMSVYSSQIAAGTASASFTGYIQSKSEAAVDEGRFVVEYLNASGSVLATYTSNWTTSVGSWQQRSDSRTIPTGTKTIRVHMQAVNNGTNYNTDVYFDELELHVQIPNRNATTVLTSEVLYRGTKTYFAGATLDTTDIYHSNNYYTSGCYDGNGATVWYKVKVDSVGYLFYNYEYSYQSGSNFYTTYSTDPYRMKVYRSLTDGDSLGGMEYKTPIGTSGTYNSLMNSSARYICVEPGYYYIQLNKCTSQACSDWVIPQVVLDYHTGDYCSNAVPLLLDTLEQQSDRLLVNCHTIGTDFGEDGSNMGCLFGPSGYKSSWFVVQYTDTAKVDLEFSLSEFTDATSNEIRYRTYYGNCQSLTPAPCNNNALTTFTLDCIRAGTYYVQIVTPEDATGELEMKVEAKENTDTSCFPVDIFQPNAAFYYNTGCPENVVQFVNTSSQGDSIRYEWDFGYNGLTDTVLHPVIDYPALNQEVTYQVKLVVIHTTRGSRDSITIPVVVPFSPYALISNTDTILCKGDSITLNASISHGVGIWNTGDTTANITVSRTGMYYYDMQDKANLLVNGGFEQNPASVGWTTVSGSWRRSSSSSYSPLELNYVGYVINGSGGLSEAYQDIDVSADSVDIDSGIAKSSMTGFLRGYQSYGDEAQVTVEYYDQSNNLLALYRTGYIANPNWTSFTHSRTTPKYTRWVRVWIQSNKVSTNNTTSYAFFDDLVFKMRSACSYRDSVYVQINELPIVEMPNDTFFCTGDSFLLNPTVYYDNPYLVQDSLNSATTGRLYNNASHTASNGYAVLTSSTTYENGEIEWTDSSLKITDTFTVSFDYFSDGYGGYATWLYLFASSTPTSEDANTGGYSINLDRQAGNQLQFNWSGSRRNTQTPGMSFDDGQWHNVQIKYVNQTFYVYFDLILIGTYTDATSRTQSGFRFGIGARNVQYANRYLVRNIHISNDNESFAVLPPNPKVGASYAWSDGYTDSARWVSTNATFTVSLTDRYGCSSNSDSVTIQAVRQYDSLFTRDESVCALLDTFQLTKPVSTGFFYGHRAVDSSGLVIVDSANNGPNQIYFSVTDTFGCITLDSGIFTVDSIPDLTFTAAGPFCRNDAPSQLIINHSSGYFFGGSFVDSSGLFDPSQTTQAINRVYYATLDSNCQGMDSIDILVDTIPQVILPAYNAFCANDSATTLAKPTSTGLFTNTSYLDSTGWFSPALSGVGNHSVIFTYTDGNGCSNSDTTTIQVDSIPDASISPSGPHCANASPVQLVAAVHSGGWFDTTNYLDSLGWFDPASAGPGSHSARYWFTDGNGCSGTDTLLIAVDTIPNASITTAGPYCLNAGKQTLTGLVNTSGRFTSSAYLDTNGIFNPAQAGVGTHKVYYAFTDGNGCTGQDSTTVQVWGIPNAAIVSAGPFCANDTSQQLSPYESGGSFSPSTRITSAGWINPSTLGGGSYLVYYQLTDTNGCSNLDSSVVQIDTVPNASLQTFGPLCANDTTQQVMALVHSGGYFSPTSYLDTLGWFDPSLAGVGSHEVRYTFTDGNGCVGDDTISVQIDSIPNAAIASAGPFCLNAGIQLLQGAVNTYGSFNSYSYIDTAGYFNPMVADTGSHVVMYTLTDGNGCSDTDTAYIQVDSLPDASILSAGPFCLNDTLQLIEPKLYGGVFVQSSYNDTAGWFDPALAGTGSIPIYHRITDGNGCSNTDSLMITVDSLPDASITAAGPFCANGGQQTLTAKVNSGGWFTPTSYLDSTGTFLPDSAGEGSHLAVYHLIDGNGCSSSDSITIRVDSIPDASITSHANVCENGGSFTLQPARFTDGIFQTTSYLDTAGRFDPSTSGSGTFVVYYSRTDGNGCSNTDSTTVVIDTIPDASITPAGPFCANHTVQQLSPKVNTGGTFLSTAWLNTSGQFEPNQAGPGTFRAYYQFTDGNGCTNRDSIDLVVDTIPDASITAAGPFCLNAGVQTLSGKINPGGRFTATSFLDTTGAFDPLIAIPGYHKIYYSFTDGNGCVGNDSTLITVDSIPDASITPAGPFCLNQPPQQLQPATHTGGLFTSTTFMDTTGLFNPTVADTGWHRVYYSLMDGNGCSNTDSLDIRVDSLPDASILQAGPFCQNDTIHLIQPAVNPGGLFIATAYLDTAGNFDPSQASVGMHTIYYQLTNGLGCAGVDSIDVQIDSIPDARIAQAGPFCANDASVQLMGAVNAYGRFDPTSWIDTSGLFQPIVAGDGTFTLFYSLLDGNGCFASDSIDITVDTLPDAQILPAGPLCANADTIILQGQIHTYGQFHTTAYLTSSGIFDPFVAGAGSHKVVYELTDGHSCTASDSIQIQVDSIPDASIVGSGPHCLNASVQQLIPSINSGGRFAPTSYLDTLGQFDPKGAGVGGHIVYYTFTDGNGCTNTDSTQILVDSLPDASISTAGPFCLNAGLQQLSGAVHTTGTFHVTTYLTNTGAFDPELAGDTTVWVFYTLTDGNGCSNTDSTSIRVDSLPDASIQPAGPFCLNNGLQQLNPQINFGGIFSGNHVDASGVFDPDQAGVGTHKNYYTYADGNGCTATDSIMVTVWSLPNSTLLPAGPFCGNADTVQLLAQVSGGTFSGGGYVLPTGRFIPTSTSPGQHQVRYSRTDANGCISSDSILITIWDFPTNTLDVVPDSGCEPLTIRFTTQAQDSIHWSINGRQWNNVTSDTTTLTSGSYVLRLYVEDGNGCGLEMDTPVTVFKNPVSAFNFSPQEIYVDNAYVTFTDQSSSDVTSWSWDFGNGDGSSDESPFTTYASGGTYSVVQTVYNNHGCVDTTLKTVLVRDNLIAFVPSAFSPNGDGSNDLFNVSGLGFAKVTCTIFNRWGEKIFESDNFTGWNGMYKDELVPSGIYVYMITLTDYRGIRHYRKGTVTLMR